MVSQQVSLSSFSAYKFINKHPTTTKAEGAVIGWEQNNSLGSRGRSAGPGGEAPGSSAIFRNPACLKAFKINCFTVYV